MKKKILSLFLALTLSLGLAIPAMAVENNYTDVDPNAYYAEAVNWAVEKGITGGTSATTFSPNQTCTRAQIITFLWRGAGLPEASVTGGVSDIKESDYFYKAVLWAKEKGMFEGNAFQPNVPCTRLMAVRFMWEAAVRPFGPGETSFSDVTPITHGIDNNDAVVWAVKWGITSGTSEATFSPDVVCTRGQIVTFLHRCDQNFQPPGTPVADKIQIKYGTYVMENNPRCLITIEEKTNGVGFEVIDQEHLTSSSGGLIIGSGRYGGVDAMWNGLEMQFYEEGFLILTVPESLSSTCSGKYILQNS